MIRRRGAGAAVMGSGRLEAFSDGVFAIAITLLVLDLAVPDPERLGGRGLAAALGSAWPSYAAYLVSFLIIGIMWINHHTLIAMVRRVDRPVLFANLALLLFVSVLPFPTRLLADYLTEPEGSHTAAAVYSATMTAIAIAFSTLWFVLTRNNGLLHAHIDARAGRAALPRYGLGVVVYLITIGVAFLSAGVTLALHAVLALYYCFDQLPIPAREPDEPPTG